MKFHKKKSKIKKKSNNISRKTSYFFSKIKSIGQKIKKKRNPKNFIYFPMPQKISEISSLTFFAPSFQKKGKINFYFSQNIEKFKPGFEDLKSNVNFPDENEKFPKIQIFRRKAPKR